MSADPVVTALSTPGHLRFPDNRHFQTRLEAGEGRLVRQSSGHLIFYRADGRRILATDPDGNPLHECEWGVDQRGTPALLRARIRLDWGVWVGLKPSGHINETTLNLATKPGWQRLTADGLRAMAAQALQVPVDEVRWFYRDEDLSIAPTGVATIRHRKDAWYVLKDGDFQGASFMSCMGAMHWASIDFLPVVELFKSLLPGTGSAAFELIRALYDDQNERRSSSLPLRYRGIPPYPSEAAFRLFKSFFIPHAPAGKDAFTLFMDPGKAHLVEWLPSPNPPLRYFDRSHGVALTTHGAELQKVTLEHDAAGLPYVSPKGRPFVPCDRAVGIINNRILVRDRHVETMLETRLPATVQEHAVGPSPISPIDWRSLFVGGMPQIAPDAAYRAVLLYPEDETPISDLSAQPFVADYLEDVAEQDRDVGRVVAQAERIVIHHGDAVIATCIAFDRPRDYTVHVREPAFAQKQAQQLWATCAQLGRWEWLERIRFIVAEDFTGGRSADLAYVWLPVGRPEPAAVAALRSALRPGACAFVTGPSALREGWQRAGFTVVWQERVDALPTFRMHQAIEPKARVLDDLTLFFVRVS